MPFADRFQRIGLRLDWTLHDELNGAVNVADIDYSYWFGTGSSPAPDALGRVMHSRAAWSESFGSAFPPDELWYYLKNQTNLASSVPSSSYYDDGAGSVYTSWSDPCVLYRFGNPVPIKVRAELVEYDSTPTELSRTAVEYAFTGLTTSIDIAAATPEIGAAPVTNKSWLLENWSAVTPTDPSY